MCAFRGKLAWGACSKCSLLFKQRWNNLVATPSAAELPADSCVGSTTSYDLSAQSCRCCFSLSGGGDESTWQGTPPHPHPLFAILAKTCFATELCASSQRREAACLLLLAYHRASPTLYKAVVAVALARLCTEILCVQAMCTDTSGNGISDPRHL